MDLAFLNLGPSELALLLVLFVLLFGAQRLPDIARSLGRFKGEMDKAQREVRNSLKSEDERALEEQLAFERLREAQMRAQSEDPEREALARAAEALGLVSAGRSGEELKAAIAARLGASAGEEGTAENAANAQQ